jgi:hypothetical protein
MLFESGTISCISVVVRIMYRNLYPYIFAWLGSFVGAATAAATENGGEQAGAKTFGWVEWVELLGGDLRLKAKLDTGALTSSLDASDITRFRRNGRRWVAFTIADADSESTVRVERPLLRNVRIVRHHGESQRRPVVSLPVCFGSVYDEFEFSLIDRSNFIYPVLLGRRALEGRVLVDPESSLTVAPKCDYEEATG